MTENLVFLQQLLLKDKKNASVTQFLQHYLLFLELKTYLLKVSCLRLIINYFKTRSGCKRLRVIFVDSRERRLEDFNCSQIALVILLFSELFLIITELLLWFYPLSTLFEFYTFAHIYVYTLCS